MKRRQGRRMDHGSFLIQTWRLHEIEGAGHMGPFTHAEIVNAQIERSLDT